MTHVRDHGLTRSLLGVRCTGPDSSYLPDDGQAVHFKKGVIDQIKACAFELEAPKNPRHTLESQKLASGLMITWGNTKQSNAQIKSHITTLEDRDH
jgi:hypothetical protein